MNPDDLRDLAALQDDLDAAVPQHLEDELLSAFRVHRALAGLRDDDRIIVPPGIEARLLDAFREYQASAIGRPSPLARFAWQLGRAAVLLAAVVAAAWFAIPRSSDKRSGSPDPGLVATVPHSPPAADDAPSLEREMASASTNAAAGSRADRGGAAAPLAAHPLAGARVAASAPRVGRPEELDDDEFMPLSYAAAVSPGGDTHVVSIDLPRSALLDFGAQPDAVPDDAAPVRAEVLMSEDGMPRGIRFVDRAPAPLLRPSGLSGAPVPSRRRLQP